MTYGTLLAEVTRRPRAEQLSLLQAVSFSVRDEICLAEAGMLMGRLPRPELALPDDPALAALEAQFE
jgi:hypothetical protein